MAFWGSFLRSGHFTDEMPSMPKKPRTPSSKVWTNCSQNVGFHFPMCLQQCSPADASLQCMAVPQHSCTQMGRRRWPPPGGVQSAAHRRWSRVLDQLPILSSDSKGLPKKSSSWPTVLIPLSIFSPQEGGDYRNPAPNFRFLRFWPIFWRIFASSKRASKITSKKHRKNCENRNFWPPKTLPKPIQNAFKIEVPKHIDFFEVFGYSFFMFVIFETLKMSISPRGN